METKLMRLKQVEDAIGLRRSAIRYAVQRGTMTKPIRIGTRTLAWPGYEIEELNRCRVRGFTHEQIVEVVRKLHAKRLELEKEN